MTATGCAAVDGFGPTSSRRLAAPARRLVAAARRLAIAVVGGSVVVVGLLLVPLPGPGWPVVFLGLAVLGREFEGARRLSRWAGGHVARARHWSAAKSLPVRAALAAAVLLAGVAPVLLLGLR